MVAGKKILKYNSDIMYHEGSIPPPIYPRGIEISPVTNQLLGKASGHSSRYSLPEALGVTSPLDREGIQLFVAKKIARENIREMRRLPTQVAVDAILAEVEGDLDKLIAAYMSDYPQGLNRPYHIQNGVNTVLTQLEITPRGGFFGRTERARRTAFEAAERWRELIQQEELPPTASSS